MLDIANCSKKVNEVRRPETKDIAKRLGILSPERIFLKNYPRRFPVTAFNASFLLGSRGEELMVYTRIILGYYKYVSAIAYLEIKVEDLYEGYVNYSHYPAEIIIGPDTKTDMWGCEDPRAQYFNGQVAMVYTGRTCFYFSHRKTERTVPILAISEDGIRRWSKVAYFTLPWPLRSYLVSNKDAVLLQTTDKVFLLHRPHLENFPPSLWYGEINKESLATAMQTAEVPEILLERNCILALPAEFEERIGWNTAPIKVGEDEYLVLAHGKGLDEVYRVFAILLKYDGGNLVISGVTPYYIMEPRTPYEKYGDRPYVVFPCGAQRYGDKLLITYGASDSFIGFAEVDLNELLSAVKSVPLG